MHAILEVNRSFRAVAIAVTVCGFAVLSSAFGAIFWLLPNDKELKTVICLLVTLLIGFIYAYLTIHEGLLWNQKIEKLKSKPFMRFTKRFEKTWSQIRLNNQGYENNAVKPKLQKLVYISIDALNAGISLEFVNKEWKHYDENIELCFFESTLDYQLFLNSDAWKATTLIRVSL